MTSMKEAVEQFKKDNGNNNFTLKEMIMVNVTEIRAMRKELSDHLVFAAAEDGKMQGKLSILTKNVLGLWGTITVLIIAFISKFKS